MTDIELKAGQVAAALGIDAKQIQNATDAGYVRPSVAGQGRGSTRLYSFEDVLRIKILDILVKAYGLELQRAAKMLSRAWPRQFTKRKKVLVITPANGSAGEGVTLEPIRLPLGKIVENTERRIDQVLESYREKKRGRPAGWEQQMRQSLAEVSGHLQNASDDQIRREIESSRTARRMREQGATDR